MAYKQMTEDEKAQMIEDMDGAAKEAAKELAKLDPKAMAVVKDWYKKWYLKAGHKRLGRLIAKG